MYDTEITITVCADTADELLHWVREFTKFFNATTIVTGKGTWEGILEPNAQVSHLYNKRNPDFKWHELDQLIRRYKREAKQFAVLTVEREVKGRLTT